MSALETSELFDREQLTALFRLLSDKTRLNILLLLANGERHVNAICEALRLPQPTISHHLGLLRESNIIHKRRAGKQVFYRLAGEVQTIEGRVLNIKSPEFSLGISKAKEGVSGDAAGPATPGPARID